MQSHNFHQQRKVGQNHNYLFQIHRLPGNCQHTLKCGFGLTLTFCTLWSSSSLHCGLLQIYIFTQSCVGPARKEWGRSFRLIHKRDAGHYRKTEISVFRIFQDTPVKQSCLLWISPPGPGDAVNCRETDFFRIWYTLPEVYIIKSINQVFLLLAETYETWLNIWDMTPCFECFSQKCEGITEPRPTYIRFKYPVSNCCVCSNIKIYVFTLFFVFSKQLWRWQSMRPSVTFFSAEFHAFAVLPSFDFSTFWLWNLFCFASSPPSFAWMAGVQKL